MIKGAIATLLPFAIIMLPDLLVLMNTDETRDSDKVQSAFAEDPQESRCRSEFQQVSR
jgi:hypothetical protein